MARERLNALSRMSIGQEINGFELCRCENIDSMSVLAVELRHNKSGARLLHLGADDPENLFSVAFRTPPPDDTGLPHILEHTVLCGSKRYPVKDPFVELLKTSLATFLNAFTYPDRTIYPCSSMNVKDFHNLLRVYCDAVFFPLITEDHFRQEGHHLEFLPDGSPLIKGIVYNEMRGVYSDPDSIMQRQLTRLLYESNDYGKDYGGDPARIPDLTYKQFVDFHRAYYHPSNAWIFTYGDADLAATLEILDKEFLSSFDAIALDSSLKPLIRWQEPRQGVFSYPFDGGSEKGKTDIAIAIATNDLRDTLESLAMRIVDSYLLDNAGSPLRKALIDSKLGEELGDSGYADYLRDTYFTATLKGSEPECADAMEKLCLDVLVRECERGFDAGKIESALRQIELVAREIRPQYPLRLLERVFGSWLYDSDPLENVRISSRLDELRKTLEADPRFLEKTAKKWLIDNPHRLRITLVPDKEFLEKSDREAGDALKKRLAGMSKQQRGEAEIIARRLTNMQSEGNSPAALATLPRLMKSDVSPEPLPLAYEAIKAGGSDFVHVPMYAGGISYLNLSLELNGLTEDDYDNLPLLCEALGKTGAAGLNYADMAAREAAGTGGLDFAPGLITHIEGASKARIRLSVSLKALDSDWEKALGIMSDRLFAADFSDTDRLRDIVLQSRVGWRSRVVPSGNLYASIYASRFLNPAAAIIERLIGCTQARFIERLAGELDTCLTALPDRLVALRDKILASAVITACGVGDDTTLTLGRDWLTANASRFGVGAGKSALPPTHRQTRRVGLAAPADVAFAALSMPAPAKTHPDAAALTLLATQLSYGYLWNEIRVKGGAYGARANYESSVGAFAFSSFRDPNIFRTLNNFIGAADYVANEMDLSPAAIEQAIIGTIKTLDKPMRPQTAVTTALDRYLGGMTEAFRTAFRTGLLSLDADAVRGAAFRTFTGIADAPVCVLSSREKITAENEDQDNAWTLDIESVWGSAEESAECR